MSERLMLPDYVSERAASSFNAIMERAARLRLKQADDDHFAISACTDHDPKVPLIVITISAISFRILVILQIAETPESRRYFLQGDEQRSFEDVRFELANLFGGVMNQELVSHIPDLGMSTPYRLDAACVQYLPALQPQYQHCSLIVINEEIKIWASICVAANSSLDFAADIDVEAVDSGGELEFF